MEEEAGTRARGYHVSFPFFYSLVLIILFLVFTREENHTRYTRFSFYVIHNEQENSFIPHPLHTRFRGYYTRVFALRNDIHLCTQSLCDLFR